MSSSILSTHHDLTLEVSEVDGYRWFRFQGLVSDASLLGCLTGIWQSPDYRFDRPELYDLREVTDMKVSADGIQTAAALDMELFEQAPAHKVAILADPGFQYGLGRMFEGYIAQREHLMKVVTDIEAAQAWLDAAVD
jgi:hypothetical protein